MPLVESQNSSHLYCPVCNVAFVQQSEERHCPRCHQEINTSGNTLYLSDSLIAREFGNVAVSPRSNGSPDNLVGKKIGIYECGNLLGRGSMGSVYLAHHQSLQRQCALKVMSPQIISKHSSFLDRFYSEGTSSAKLVHPHVVTTHAMGEEEGVHFLEMELVNGPTLQQLIETEGRLTPIRSTALATQIADGMAEAHRHDVLHRDLKPDNILLNLQGLPKIGDFGLAKQVFDESAPDELAGTPHFMAPEVLLGEPASFASDVYSLGVCYYLMLTGKLPFSGRDLRELTSVVNEHKIPSIKRPFPEISLEMIDCVCAMLAKAPENRPANALEASQWLHAIWGQIPDIESLLQSAFEGHSHVSWDRQGRLYTVTIHFSNGRHQKVFIEPSDHALTDRLLKIYSLCGPAEERYFEQALLLNSKIQHGGLALQDIEGERYFVVVDNYPRSTVDIEEVYRSVLEVAQKADSVEKILTGLDVH